ncbi:MAG: hypothetical protein LAP85_08400 [Acidobacteriia bacterium]|nr:hypothetical protein [Terriglobia bacterium]
MISASSVCRIAGTVCLSFAAVSATDTLRAGQEAQELATGGRAAPEQIEELDLGVIQKPASTPTCPDPVALERFKYFIAYERMGQEDPWRGLQQIHLNVWQQGRLTGFYMLEEVPGAVSTMRISYLFSEDGPIGGGSCPAELDWQKCVVKYTYDNYRRGLPIRRCTTTIDLRTIPLWEPSPDNEEKRRVAAGLRKEIETKWHGVQEIVVRDFNLKDNGITIYMKTRDGDFFQGCEFHVTDKVHCDSWHSFGMISLPDLKKWIFERPYRLK